MKSNVCLFFTIVSMMSGTMLAAQQEARQFEKQIVIGYRYLLHLPENYYETKSQFPLVLFLHGSGERGDDLEKVKQHGLPKLIAEGRTFPFLVVSPQCPQDVWWNSMILKELLDSVQENYRIDKDHVYVTGLSMGGFATWELIAAYPGYFAAAIPVCGGGNRHFARRMRDLPIWAFHGAKDPVVPLAASRDMVEAVQNMGGDVKLTVYPDLEHDSWTVTYENQEIYDWLLRHRRKPDLVE